MKTTLTIIALALTLGAQAQDRSLDTTDGATFKNITLERIEPDGLYIEYSLPHGGLGMSKIKFARLPRALQKQYGYTESAAQDYEAQVAQANADVAKELTDFHEIQQNARRQHDAENERAYGGRMAEIRRVNAEHAAAFYRGMKADPDGNRTIEVWSQFTSGRPSTQTSYSGFTPDIFNRNTVIKSH